MAMKRSAGSLLAPIGALLSLLAAAPGCGEATGGAFDQEASGIYAGSDVQTNNDGVVAVYHIVEDSLLSHWYDHPCTGVVLNPSATNNYLVLTARHCVTPIAGGDDGTPLRPFGIKVSAELAPGRLPPANAAVACEILAPSVPNTDPNLKETLDMAIVRVCKTIPGLSATANPLYMGCSDNFMDQKVVAYGYGYGDNTEESAGRLRRSSQQVDAFWGPSTGLTGYDYNTYRLKDSPTGAYLTNGDSGGPSFWKADSNSLYMQVGVHSGFRSFDTAVSRITTQWIQNIIQRFYIRPQDAMNRALTRSGDQSGASINAAATSGIVAGDLPQRQWFRYEFALRRIVVGDNAYQPTCLRRNSDNTLKMAFCDGSTSQKWWINGTNRIQDNTDTLCLQKSGTSGVVVASCSSSTSQKWYFDADSRVAGVQ